MSLTAPRNTQLLDARPTKLLWPVKGSTKIYQGSQVVLNAGYAVGGSTATSLIAIGTAAATVDNSGGSDGALSIEVWISAAKWDNKGSDLVVAADVGSSCYVYDDHTVNHTSTGASVAGKVLQIDSDGVWVAPPVLV